MAFSFTVIILLIGSWCILSHACGRTPGTGACPPGYTRDAPKQVEKTEVFRKLFKEPYAQVLCGRAGGLGPCPPGFSRDEPKQVEKIEVFPKKFKEQNLARRNKATGADAEWPSA